MRSEKAQDYWRKIKKNEAPLKINKIAFRGINGVGSGEFVFGSSINGVCGKNGLGKSTLLKAIYLTLSQSEKTRFPEVVERLKDASFKIELSEHELDRVIEFGPDNPRVNAIYLDPSELCHVSLEFLRQEKNLDELLEQYDFAPLDETSLKEVRRILGRRYDSIEFAEMDDFGGYEALPFFRVSLHDAAYDSRDMALGELSVLYVWWTLWKKIDAPYLVLLEEPENFLTPQAQRYLTDYIAFVALKSHLWVLLSTHSEHVIENVGLEATSVVVENQVDGSVIVKNPRHKMEVLEHLGLDPRKRGLILVEDEAGKGVFEEACSFFGSFLLHDFEVIATSGSGPIKKLLENFPRRSKSVECIGIFDGDERSKIKSGALNNCFFLPGTLSPEKIFESIIQEDPKRAADALNIRLETLVEKLSVVVGRDEHDWFDDLRKALHLDYKTSIRDLSRLWVNKDEASFRALISSLDSSVSSVLEPNQSIPRRVVGKIEIIKSGRGYGFIRSEDGERLFFHLSALEDISFDAIKISMGVSFEIQTTDRPLNAAVRIKHSN